MRISKFRLTEFSGIFDLHPLKEDHDCIRGTDCSLWYPHKLKVEYGEDLSSMDNDMITILPSGWSGGWIPGQDIIFWGSGKISTDLRNVIINTIKENINNDEK